MVAGWEENKVFGRGEIAGWGADGRVGDDGEGFSNLLIAILAGGDGGGWGSYHLAFGQAGRDSARREGTIS